MAAPIFPRPSGALPRLVTPPRFPGGLQAWSQSGKGQTRAIQNMGRVWSETYPVLDTANPSVRLLMQALNRALREGLVWSVQHPYWHTRKGVGGGSPVVGGAGQSGSNLIVSSAPTNQLVTQPTNFGHADWTKDGTVALTSGQADPFGGILAYLISDPDAVNLARIHEVVTFTADGTKCISVFMKQGTSGFSSIGIYDSTAALWRAQGTVVWTAGVPALSLGAGSGTLFPVESWPGGWYRISLSVNNVVAANQNNLYLNATSEVGAATGTTYFFGANAWNAVVPQDFWLRPGDLISVAGVSVVLDVQQPVFTNNVGGATIPIQPPIFVGNSPLNAAIVETNPANIYFNAIIAAIDDFPAMDTTRYIDAGLTVHWREQPQ